MKNGAPFRLYTMGKKIPFANPFGFAKGIFVILISC